MIQFLEAMNYSFNSPIKGILLLEDVVLDIAEFISEWLDMAYKLIIGTDSNSKIDPNFVTVITMYRAGRGGRYY